MILFLIYEKISKKNFWFVFQTSSFSCIIKETKGSCQSSKKQGECVWKKEEKG